MTHSMNTWCGLRGATLLTLALFVGACSSTKGGQTADMVDKSPWIEPSPLLKQQIDDEAKRLPWTHGFERLEQIRWFASVGEPAFASLLVLAEDPRDDVAAAALAALGATVDRRLVPYIRDINWSPGRQNSDLGLERARTLLRLGDWSGIPVLIDGLRDERLYTRSLCIEALREATHEKLDYDPRADLEERDQGVMRWVEWWSSRSGDSLVTVE